MAGLVPATQDHSCWKVFGDTADTGPGGSHADPADGRSGGIAAAGHHEGPRRWVEHGRGEAPLAVIEPPVTRHDLLFRLRHDPTWPVAAVGFPDQRDGGSVAVPEALQPYMGTDVLRPA